MKRIAIVWITLVALLLPSTHAAFAKPLALQSDNTDDSGSTGSAVVGNSYTSPSFGYSITWDNDWTVSDELNQEDYNKLVLTDNVATVYVEGVADSSTPSKCVDTIASSMEQQDGVSKVQEVPNADDPETGNISDREWGVYSFTYTPDTGDPLELYEYIDCRPVEAGKSLAVISSLTTADDYDSELEPLGALLEGFAIDGSTGPSDTGDNSGDSGTADTTSPDESQIASFVQISAKDVDDFWTREFPVISGGTAYTPPADVISYDKPMDTDGCGAADVGGGPFYCPSDQTVYYDLVYGAEQVKNLGDSAIAVAVAHEIGHHVQNLMDWKECVQTPCLDPTEMTSQEIELQADCFAGAWTADAETRGRLGSFDIEANIVQFAVFLNDPSGNVADPGAHGKGARRVYSFLTGYYEGVPACLKISAASDPDRNGGTTNSTNNSNSNNSTKEPTATPEDEPTATSTDNGNEPTATTSNSTDAIQMGDSYTVDFKDSSATMTVTETEQADSLGVDGVPDADGTYLVVYFSVKRDASAAGPFPYSNFIVTDSDGNQYTFAEAATDGLLKTSDTFPDGIDQDLDLKSTYNVAIVFDVPADASGFVFSTDTGDSPVELDK